MPTIDSITADPTTVPPGGTSTITVRATADKDRELRVVGQVVGTTDRAEVAVTVDGPDVRFTLDATQAKPGDVLVSAPDGGTLVEGSSAGVYTFVA